MPGKKGVSVATRALSKRFGSAGENAVDGVDISIDRGETVCVVGESGCGKTVTAMTVLKLVPMPHGKIVAGEVLWQGRDLVTDSTAERRRVRATAVASGCQGP